MSLSPTKSSSSADILAYDKGWAAINRLIRAGRSFSGRERNCCFLNLGATRFANVSSAVELNLIDDGRGLVQTDWDADGRIDFWVTNRNGPRIRFLKNEYTTDHHFLALRLAGTHANRDAIGARVEVYRHGTTNPLIKSVYAGSGYISQSSKWLHFGLGNANQIDRVIVRWPGGDAESFPHIDVDRRYRLVEGSAVAEPVSTPRTGPWNATPAIEPPLAPASRVVLLEPSPLPDQLVCRDLEGNERPIIPKRNGVRRDRAKENGGRGMLVNLWATWCTNCLHELSEWSAAKQSLDDAGIDVLAICVDEPTDDRSADFQRIRDFASQQGIPFPVAVGDQHMVEILNVFQRAFIGRQSDLPLPSSVLIDAQGRVAVIYKGPVHIDQVLRDIELLDAPAEQIIEGAVPFRGKWLERPPVTGARLAAVALLEHGYQQAAHDYAVQLLTACDPAASDLPADSKELDAMKQEYSSLNHLIGAILFDRKDYEGAQARYRASLSVLPNNRGLRRELCRTLMRMNRLEPAAEQLVWLLDDHADDAENLAELARLRIRLGQPLLAIELFRKSVALRPRPDVRFELANALRDANKYEQAVQQYRAVMEDVPSPAVINNLAWLLATASDDQVRDGEEAVRLAQKACEATSRRVPKILGTLAAAHAEQGDFDSAVSVVREAIEQAKTEDTSLVVELQQRLQDYQNTHATRD